MLPESGLLIAVSWRPALLPELEPINVQQRGSAAANACFRLLKNQPQRHHLWPLCWNSQDTPPHPILLSSPPHQPFLSHSPSAFTSVQPWECFHPSLLQATCAQYNLHHEPYETPSAHSPISCHSLPPPTTFIVFFVFEWYSQQFALSCVWQKKGFEMCLVVSVMCVLLMELVEDAPRHWSGVFSWRHFGLSGCQSLRASSPESQTACGQSKCSCMFNRGLWEEFCTHVHTLLYIYTVCVVKKRLTQRQNILNFDCHRNASLLLVALLLTRFFCKCNAKNSDTHNVSQWRNVEEIGDLF